MKTYSKTQPPIAQGIGPTIRVHFDFEQIEIDGETHWCCEEVILDRNWNGPGVPYELPLEITEDPLYD